MAAAPWIVSDELWELVEPLLPREERRCQLSSSEPAQQTATTGAVYRQ